MSDIPKAYDPKAVEQKWYSFWEAEGYFVANPRSSKPAYSIVIPPPNVTGVLHMGHVLNNTIQDILARKARMDGKEVLWLPGTDHAGIATQAVVEKTLRKQGVMKHRDELGREKFLEYVWAWKEKHGNIIIQQLKRLGCSCDWSRLRFTMDPEYSRCVQKVFVDLYNKGLIYRGTRMVNWDPAARTALSDEEVEMVEEKGHLWYIKYPLLDEAGAALMDQFVVVATTRPETMLGDEAVAVHPADERYKKLVGRKVLLPLQNKPIPIIADEVVDPKFGTGCVKVTPAHDPADYEIALRHKLPFTVVIGLDGCMTPAAGEEFAGLDRMEAREAVVEQLKELGLLLKVEDYVHNVGYSQRSHVPIEPMLSEQWFLKYPSVERATEAVEHGEIRFHPSRWVKTYTHWMRNLKDWCISRQLWWGHRIPVWYNKRLESALAKSVRVVTLTGREITGRDVRAHRKNALAYARAHGIIGGTFLNEDTGMPIRIRARSLTHAFTHRGLDQIKAIAALPELLRTAVKVCSEFHQPRIPGIRAVHFFWAALAVGKKHYSVKLTVKELADGSLLYDHHLIKRNAPDGGAKSAGAHLRPETLASRPSSSALQTMPEFLEYVNMAGWAQRCQIECPGPDWEQDPDVLDTWFSSWLWPFATMGWTGDPEKDARNELLAKFYPTSDLVTGPDIIFFWVARMIMAGFEYMGKPPFRNVYFTGIIRDKLGRKMSKSLGNSPDPLDLIDKYGADALRFGTMRSAPLGQDVLFDEKNVELGRNFCNKLWNACRFRQLQGDSADVIPTTNHHTHGHDPLQQDAGGASCGPVKIDPALLTSDDKWILLKLDQAIREINEAFAEYRFNEVTQILYRFFWSEYCDWYVEASKAVLMRGGEPCSDSTIQSSSGSPEQARRANTLAVIDFVLSHALRLFHPFLPHITEEL
ncbi:MAG: valine--tRNA ligase, partial [Verrucomicrobiae bacterium]|nr:valine--tRNA ligase [Verrucomicrobiae bacterium]